MHPPFSSLPLRIVAITSILIALAALIVSMDLRAETHGEQPIESLSSSNSGEISDPRVPLNTCTIDSWNATNTANAPEAGVTFLGAGGMRVAIAAGYEHFSG